MMLVMSTVVKLSSCQVLKQHGDDGWAIKIEINELEVEVVGIMLLSVYVAMLLLLLFVESSIPWLLSLWLESVSQSQAKIGKAED